MATNCKAIPITVPLLVVFLQLFLLLHTAESAAIGKHGSKTPTSDCRKLLFKIDLTRIKSKEGHTFVSLESDDYPPNGVQPLQDPPYMCDYPQCEYLPDGEYACHCT